MTSYKMSMHNHPFHMVEKSPWPLICSLNMLIMTTGFIKWFHYKNYWMFIISLITMSISSYQWWRDITREATYQGLHSKEVYINLNWGMILFIISEIFFFLSFFWAYFHASLSPNIEIGMTWPPLGIKAFNPYHIPLLNTIILISSGASITWSHHSLINKKFNQTLISLMITITLGIYFSYLQKFEYTQSLFSISDSIYGSTFFLTTGFHGIHVIIGTTFLTVCLTRLVLKHFSYSHHFNFEAASWYWHFVDIIWLFLYISIYWWSYNN
uniref:Cytochrome c oxidase subunit 3 n=1 Tax=Stenocephus fraxini TaxID=2963023 RepID=A0A9E8YZP7_9HYME|nr:cytochrome c oxidase subunit III [Stenocephus fraxini]WAK85073.1 cytochrome c oxidase subunit III [Stenocephus fraxini]